MIVSEPFSVAYGLGRMSDVLCVDIGAGTTDLCRMHGTIPTMALSSRTRLTAPSSGSPPYGTKGGTMSAPAVLSRREFAVGGLMLAAGLATGSCSGPPGSTPAAPVLRIGQYWPPTSLEPGESGRRIAAVPAARLRPADLSRGGRLLRTGTRHGMALRRHGQQDLRNDDCAAESPSATAPRSTPPR